MDELLRLEGIRGGYGRREVLHGISFVVRQGETAVLLGANGSGKSTLLKALAGLTHAFGGCVLDGKDLREMPVKARACQIGYLSQRPQVTLDLTSLEVVLMGYNPVLGLLERPNGQQKARARLLMQKLGVGGAADLDYQTLSEGQRQLVLLARTLVCEPRLLLLDEPDSALDYANRHNILRYLRQHAQEKGMGILFCTHDANTALRYGDRLLLMQEGRVIEDISMERADRGMLERALSRIYGDVEVLPYKGYFLMTGGSNGCS